MKKWIILLSLLGLGSSAFAKDLVVHEWGTFTSFMGSNGERQEGLHTEDEPLPNFVYGVKNSQERQPPVFEDPCDFPSKIPCDLLGTLDQNNRALAGFLGESLPENPIQSGITQKMETPVIYFYGDAGQKVQVEIGFPTGIISQYFPKAKEYTPKFSEINSLGPSKFLFDVNLLTTHDNSGLPYTRPDSIWNPARDVKANTIAVEGEKEKFIFYRGVADFKNNFQVTSTSKDQLILKNLSSLPVKQAFVLMSDGKKGVIQKLGAVKSTLKANVPSLQDGDSYEQYVKKAKGLIASALVEDGLYLDEARALVNTWEKSYFQTPGLRVLYIVPTVETERILPMKVTPTPKELVRSLVGRVEIMTHNQERDYLRQLMDAGTVDVEKMFGRFHEPKLRRLLQLVTTSGEFTERHREALTRKIEGLL